MATVYKAYDTRLERDVAIKVIRMENFAPSVVAHTLKRFEREAKSLARLEHPNIIPIHDYGEHEGSPYLVMRYIPGGTLKSQTGRAMPYAAAARLLAPVARALAYAHSLNVIHRDVKPANILITSAGEPMLSDFGVAKILESDEGNTLTGTGVGIGTPEYMAPEQWVNKVVPQTDIYALGVVFYELITGRKPYSADTPAAVLIKQTNDPLPRPKLFVPGLPDPVEQVLFKALAKSPEARYASMSEFASALEKLSAGAETLQSPNPVKPPSRPAAPQPSDFTYDSGQSPLSPVVKAKRSGIPVWVYLLGGVLVLGLIASSIISTAGLGLFPARSTPTPTPPAQANQVTAPNPTAIPTAAAVPTQGLKVGSSQISPKDGMKLMYVPAGEFQMGSEKGSANEKPVHSVSLDAFWIDQTEVTNAMYARCASVGACRIPFDSKSNHHNAYYGSEQFAAYPVIYVDWNQAVTYCKWAGRSLPTEAQWEKAARGVDGRTYPWGESIDQQQANYNLNSNDTEKVGSHPAGASPYGALDMGGNVYEWVSDWFGPYSADNKQSNPGGPVSGESRIFRGGSWIDSTQEVRASFRATNSQIDRDNNLGFRCALNAAAN